MKGKKHYNHILICIVLFYTNAAMANNSALERCLLEHFKQAAADTPMSKLHHLCKEVPTEELSAIDERLFDEQLIENNPFIITAHKPNYVLPLTYNERLNEAPYSNLEGKLRHFEVKFQLSLKLQIASGILGHNNSLFFAYTNQSYWQAYNNEFSSPFRETNHEPEVFLLLPQRWSLFGLKSHLIALGLSHQSNGRSGSQSRGWNRLYANFIFEQNNMVFSFRPWYRIPEEPKDYASDPIGDDNPQIEDYLGHGEFRAIYKREHNTFSLMLRNNLRTSNRGAIELSWSFPLGERLKGYAQYFNGYGESLIDYDARVNRLGVGIALTDWL